MPLTVLVTGATGYIASRLIPRLLDAGYSVRCLARRPEGLKRRTWYNRVQVVTADVTRFETLALALDGVSVAYYLIHSMSAGHGYHDVDLDSAHNFGLAAKNAGVEQIIYLGGLANPGDPTLALHLKSRLESGDALREAGVPVTEFRAGVIVGPGSVSFEMIRFIAEQFPILLGPAWLHHQSQPIATSNVLDFLMAALDTPLARGRVIEIGGLETYTYIDIMTRYARIRGLKRIPFLVGSFPVWFMAYFIKLLTPVELSYAYPLVGGLQNDSVVIDRKPLELFTHISLLDFSSSVRQALAETNPIKMERVWLDFDRDALGIKHEGMFIDYRRLRLPAGRSSSVAFANLARKIMDQPLRLGGIKDFSLECLSEDTLRLKVISQHIPGEAWLEWRIIENSSVLEQTAFFAPLGLPGFISWYGLHFYYQYLLARCLRRVGGL